MNKKLKIILSILVLIVFIAIIFLVSVTSFYKNSINSFAITGSMYEFYMTSTEGFSNSQIDEINARADGYIAEGAYAYSLDLVKENNHRHTMQVYNITENVNELTLVAGRMPQEESECLVDASMFYEDEIGQNITFSSDVTKDVRACFNNDTYTIVGIVLSPICIGDERTTTSGTDSYMYLLNSSFTSENYNALYIKLSEDYQVTDGEFEEIKDDKSQAILTDVSSILLADTTTESEQKAEEDTKAAEPDTDSKDAIDSASYSVNAREDKLTTATSNLSYYYSLKTQLETEINNLKSEIATMEAAAQTDSSILSSATYTYTKASYNNKMTEYNNLLVTISSAENEIGDYEMQYDASLAQYDAAKSSTDKSDSDTKNTEEETTGDVISDTQLPVITICDRTSAPGYETVNGLSGLFEKVSYAIRYIDYIYTAKHV